MTTKRWWICSKIVPNSISDASSLEANNKQWILTNMAKEMGGIAEHWNMCIYQKVQYLGDLIKK